MEASGLRALGLSYITLIVENHMNPKMGHEMQTALYDFLFGSRVEFLVLLLRA